VGPHVSAHAGGPRGSPERDVRGKRKSPTGQRGARNRDKNTTYATTLRLQGSPYGRFDDSEGGGRVEGGVVQRVLVIERVDRVDGGGLRGDEEDLRFRL